MKNTASLFSYRSGTTFVHKTPAGIKFILLICLTVAVFTAGNIPLEAASILLVVFFLAARVPVKVFFYNFRVLFWYSVMIYFFRFAGKPYEPDLFGQEMAETGRYVWQIAAVLVAGTIFYETTSSLEIRYFFSSVQSAIQQGIDSLFHRILRKKLKSSGLPDIALLLSLTITFIPRIFEAWTTLNHAWDARGGNAHKNPAGAFRRFSVLVPALLTKLFAVAFDTDRAVRNRSVSEIV
jgi:energy-coupling factor transporter transmembrane protein EcfT